MDPYTILMLQMISGIAIAIIIALSLFALLLGLVIYPRIKEIIEQVTNGPFELSRLLVQYQADTNNQLLSQIRTLSGKMKAVPPPASSLSTKKKLFMGRPAIDTISTHTETIEMPLISDVAQENFSNVLVTQ